MCAQGPRLCGATAEFRAAPAFSEQRLRLDETEKTVLWGPRTTATVQQEKTASGKPAGKGREEEADDNGRCESLRRYAKKREGGGRGPLDCYKN